MTVDDQPGAQNSRGPTVCLIIPSGTWDLEPITTSLRTHQPDLEIVAVWCGDPHRRPPIGNHDLRWCDSGLPEVTGVGWNRLIVALPQRAYEWARTAAAVERLLDLGRTSPAVTDVVVLRVGSVAVLGPISSVVGAASVTLLERAATTLPADALSPSEANRIVGGAHSTAVACFRSGAEPALRWLGDQIANSHGHEATAVGPWFDRLSALFHADLIDPTFASAPGWRDPDEVDLGVLAVVDLEHVDRAEPWHFDFGPVPARVRLSQSVALAAVVAKGWKQCAGLPHSVLLPGGIPVDGAVRSLMAEALSAYRAGRSTLPPEPFGQHNSEFTRWLEEAEPASAAIGRYWLAVREERPDLQAVFPQPQAADAARMVEWATNSWRLEVGPAILRSHSAGAFGEGATPGVGMLAITSAGFDASGVNVLGYLDFDQSQGHIARAIVEILRAAHVPVAPLNFHRSLGSKRSERLPGDRSALFATNIVVVNADQFLFVVADHGQTLLCGRHTIAYWFWELEYITEAMLEAVDNVDEIWAGSAFVANAFAAVTDKPVRCVPLPVPEPQPSGRDRESFGLPDDRFVFLATFDQFSVPERKNPFGVIDAFTTAFAENEGPILWIKTMNGSRGWRNHERLLLAAAHREDIVVWDQHLSRPDQMAVLNVADCLVSLHRSEGLGLHCAEAMWLAKPVIATRYSGNLDFMDDSCAALVDYDMIPVRNGEGIYPECALWADPHVDEAAQWMRTMACDRERAAAIGRAGRARMQAQASSAATGALMARLANLRPGDLNPRASAEDTRRPGRFAPPRTG